MIACTATAVFPVVRIIHVPTVGALFPVPWLPFRPSYSFFRLPAGPLDHAWLWSLSSRAGCILVCAHPWEILPEDLEGNVVELVVYKLFAGTYDSAAPSKVHPAQGDF
jgi:hypothetical protein